MVLAFVGGDFATACFERQDSYLTKVSDTDLDSNASTCTRPERDCDYFTRSAKTNIV